MANRLRDVAHGAGFALLALGAAMAPLSGWTASSFLRPALLASCGALLLATTRPGAAAPGRAPWTQERTLGYFAGAAAFWCVFLGAGALAVAPGPVEASPPPSGMRAVGEASHTFLLDPTRYLALGAPSVSIGPAWAPAQGSVALAGHAQWNASSGLGSLDVTVETGTGESWAEAGRWTLRPGEPFHVTLPEGQVARVSVRPHMANAAFEPVAVRVDATFLAP